MHISRQEEYALRCALQLARHHAAHSLHDSSVGILATSTAFIAPSAAEAKTSLISGLSAAKIAEREGLSMEYVTKLLSLLRKSGLVLTNRGQYGGFQLTRPADEISVWDVLTSVSPRERGGLQAQRFCSEFAGADGESCTHEKKCGVRPVWNVIFVLVERVTRSLTLADLLKDEAVVSRRMDQLVPPLALSVEAMSAL